MEVIFARLKKMSVLLLQRLVITIQLHMGNGLGNHAAAGAYGILLSLAPMFLLIAFFILAAFDSPQIIGVLFDRIDILDTIIDDEWLTRNFLAVTSPGIAGVISVLSILWACRIFALAIQRGLNIIFKGTKTRNPIKEFLVTFAVEIAVLLLILIVILGSQTMIHIIRFFNFFQGSMIIHFVESDFARRLFMITILGLVSFLAYLFIPLYSPNKSSALKGTFLCILGFGLLSVLLQFILSYARYNMLYGALGNIIILLVNVYFFFFFFFLGAQFAYVIDSFDVLFFVKMRQAKIKSEKQNDSRKTAKKIRFPNLFKTLFLSAHGHLGKYFRRCKKDQIIFSHTDNGNEVYYIIEGEAEILFSSASGVSSGGILSVDSFFGRRSYLLSKEQGATIKAKTDVSVLVLPYTLFEAILKYDRSFDKDIIQHMSRKIKQPELPTNAAPH